MAGVHPGDLTGVKLQILGKLTAVDMTTTAVFNVFNNGPNNCIICYHVLGNFSAFPIGQPLPATWAFSVGRTATSATAPTAPTDLVGATPITGSKAPYLNAQGMTNTNAYIAPFNTLYFAISTATNGVGTFDYTALGVILAK